MPVKTDRHGGVLVVQLDRDEKRNAINGEMTMAIDAALNDAEDDLAVRAIVLAGGPSVFCAGTDIAEGSGPPTERGGEYGVIRRRSTTPIIAAIEGAAFGGDICGTVLLLAQSLTAAISVAEISPSSVCKTVQSA